MNYLRELWGFRNVRPVPRSRAAARPPVSLRPYPQQQPGAAGSSREQPRSSSPVALPRGFVDGFARYVTNMSVFVAERNAGNGRPLHIGASRYMPTCPSAAFSRNFLFLFFFILGHGVQSLILGHF